MTHEQRRKHRALGWLMERWPVKVGAPPTEEFTRAVASLDALLAEVEREERERCCAEFGRLTVPMNPEQVAWVRERIAAVRALGEKP